MAEPPSNELRLPVKAKGPAFLINFISIFLFLMFTFSGFSKLTSMWIFRKLYEDHLRAFGQFQALLFGGVGRGMDATSLRVLVAMTEIFLGSLLLAPQAGPPIVGLASLMGITIYCHVRLGHPSVVIAVPSFFLFLLLTLLFLRRTLFKYIKDATKEE